MADGLILEFEGFGVDVYDRVNRELGIDMATGEGDWPAGMRYHAGGAKPGGWVVFEVWDSKEDQDRFMTERLGPALQRAGVEAPPVRIEWLQVAAQRTL